MKSNCSSRTVLPKQFASSPAWRKRDSRVKPSVDSKFPFHLSTSFWVRRCSRDVSVALSPAFAAAALAILGLSAYTVQEDVNFLAAVLALISRPSPDHVNRQRHKILSRILASRISRTELVEQESHLQVCRLRLD